MNIALIPARGGSKRLPNKNLSSLNNRPLIAHSILYASNSELIDEVWVSTDSDEIANVATRFGAKSIIRPDRLAEDSTQTSEVIGYHVQNFLKQEKKIDWIFILQPTNPVRPSKLISKAFEKLIKEGRSALACFSPLHKKFGIIKNKKFIPENYYWGQRSQEIKERYYENGLLYIVKANLAKKGILFPEDLFPFVINSIHGTVDIDYEEDLEYAQIVIEYLKAKKSEDWYSWK